MSMKKYEEWNANHKHDNPPREKIVKLGRKITDVAGHIFGGVKVEDPEYWGLAEIVSDEMADIALAMKKRTPYTFKEMCDLCKVSKDQEEHFQKTLDEMSYLGLLEYDYGYHYDHHGRTAPQSERRYILPMFVPGSAELFNMEELPDRSGARPAIYGYAGQQAGLRHRRLPQPRSLWRQRCGADAQDRCQQVPRRRCAVCQSQRPHYAAGQR